MAIINNSINNTLQTPFHLGAISVSTTGTQLNYLNATTGVTGTGNLALSISPTFSTSLHIDNLELSGNTFSSTNTNGNILINPNGTGNVVTGYTASLFPGGAAGYQSYSATQEVFYIQASFLNSSTDAGSFANYKSRGASIGSFTAVQSGDNLGSFSAAGSDGTTWVQSSYISARVDGSVSSLIVPGRLEFYTCNSSGVNTLGLTLNSSQVATFTNPIVAPGFSPSSTTGIIGTTTNNNAAAGSVGEFVDSGLISATAFVTTLTNQNFISISLTAGDWDVAAAGAYTATGTTVTTAFGFNINKTSGAFPAGNGTNVYFIGNGIITISIPIITGYASARISIASTTTVYLVAQAGWTGSAPTFAGQMTARRVR